jgi:predicted nucleotidyltransferase
MPFLSENEKVRTILDSEQDLEFAVLIGSRSSGKATVNSDWDIAIRWRRGLPKMTILLLGERLRNRLAHALQISDAMIDLVDISSAGLAMRAVVVEEGIPLKGGDSIAWNRFLSRTWREIEEFYWESVYAA